MKKSFFIPVLIFTSVIFVCGILFGIAGSALGGNPNRAILNINKNSTLNIIVQTPEPTAPVVPYGNDYFYGTDPYGYNSDIFEFFNEFGLGEEFGDFFSPYGGYEYVPENDPVKIY